VLIELLLSSKEYSVSFTAVWSLQLQTTIIMTQDALKSDMGQKL